ncbi:CNPY3_4 [Mytilus edulis]|uniref:CNPY3_4 n=1 Tax=Mytilus edulis TaxID=6550 RepID=A0A8S3T2L0_MYTED|nr:CNPY3_4 [Mytilus edulis]
MCPLKMASFLLFLGIAIVQKTFADVSSDGVIMPSKCEVCKYLVVELQSRLDETGKNKEVIRTGHGIDPSKKKQVDYRKSDLRLIEAIHEPHCDTIVEQYDEDLEDWYYNHQDEDLMKYLCKDRVLTKDDQECLVEEFVPELEEDEEKKEEEVEKKPKKKNKKKMETLNIFFMFRKKNMKGEEGTAEDQEAKVGKEDEI